MYLDVVFFGRNTTLLNGNNKIRSLLNGNNFCTNAFSLNSQHKRSNMSFMQVLRKWNPNFHTDSFGRELGTIQFECGNFIDS